VDTVAQVGDSMSGAVAALGVLLVVFAAIAWGLGQRARSARWTDAANYAAVVAAIVLVVAAVIALLFNR
jgi:hypothetical protein